MRLDCKWEVLGLVETVFEECDFAFEQGRFCIRVRCSCHGTVLMKS
jgi:hypothetical protein